MSEAWPRLVVRCARVRQTPERLDGIRRLAESCASWGEVTSVAERQGVGPLLFRHVTASGAAIPDAARRTLQALYVRHRRENGVRIAVLGEVLDAFHAASIPVVVLKGPAMIALVYGDAALRPMGDLDLLVPAPEARRAQALLLERGWVSSPDGDGAGPRHHHLPGLRHARDGVALAIEIHRDAIHDAGRASLRLEVSPSGSPSLVAFDRGRRLPGISAPRSFSLGGVRGCALGPEEALWHGSHHLRSFHSKLLLLLADLVGLGEGFADQLDWDRLKREFPFVPQVLSLIDLLDPLPPRVAARVPRVDGAMAGVGATYAGWPSTRVAAVRTRQGARRLVLDTVLPPEWWLRLHYGSASTSRMVLTLLHLRNVAALAAAKMRDA